MYIIYEVLLKKCYKTEKYDLYLIYIYVKMKTFEA